MQQTQLSPRIKRPARPPRRRTFEGVLNGDVLMVTRGCHVVETDKQGDVIARRRDAQAIAIINIGDIVIVEQKSGGLAALETASVESSAWSRQSYRVRVRHGRATGDVWVLPTKLGKFRKDARVIARTEDR